MVIGQETASPLYQSDFQNIAPDSLPDDLKPLSGAFTIKQEESNRFLELSPTPLNSFGLLIGPERGADTSIRSRIRGWPTGKRFPEFGIGLGGAGGYSLWVMPAVNEVQIRKSNQILARAPFPWKPGEWVHLQFQLRSADQGRWIISGKAWHEGDTAAGDWMIRHEITEPPLTGRSTLWGTPYSEKPIQFDDVRVDEFESSGGGLRL